MANLNEQSLVRELGKYDTQSMREILSASGFTQAEIDNLRKLANESGFQRFTLQEAANVMVSEDSIND